MRRNHARTRATVLVAPLLAMRYTGHDIFHRQTFGAPNPRISTTASASAGPHDTCRTVTLWPSVHVTTAAATSSAQTSRPANHHWGPRGNSRFPSLGYCTILQPAAGLPGGLRPQRPLAEPGTAELLCCCHRAAPTRPSLQTQPLAARTFLTRLAPPPILASPTAPENGSFQTDSPICTPYIQLLRTHVCCCTPLPRRPQLAAAPGAPIRRDMMTASEGLSFL